MGTNAVSKPPYANTSRTIAFSHTLPAIGPSEAIGAGWNIVTAAPARITISSGKIFATVNMLLTRVPCRTPSMLISASKSNQHGQDQKTMPGSLAPGQNSAR